MRTQRKVATPEERNERLKREVQRKIAEAAADEVAVDEMIRRNVDLYGP